MAIIVQDTIWDEIWLIDSINRLDIPFYVVSKALPQSHSLSKSLPLELWIQFKNNDSWMTQMRTERQF